MSYVTVEVDIDHGKVIPRDPSKLPEKASGILTIFPHHGTADRKRARLPLIQGDGKRLINPSAEDLDASLWD